MVFCRFSGKKPWCLVKIVPSKKPSTGTGWRWLQPRYQVRGSKAKVSRNREERSTLSASGTPNEPGKLYPCWLLISEFPYNISVQQGFFQTYTIWFNIAIWLVVYLNLWKIWKSVGSIIPNLWKIIQMFQTTNQIPLLIAYYLGLIGSTTTWLKLGLL